MGQPNPKQRSQTPSGNPRAVSPGPVNSTKKSPSRKGTQEQATSKLGSRSHKQPPFAYEDQFVYPTSSRPKLERKRSLQLQDLQGYSSADIKCAPSYLFQYPVGIKKSSEGASGVYFVKTRLGIVVIKSSASAGQELFGVRMGQALGVKVCDMVCYSNSEELRKLLLDAASTAGADNGVLDSLRITLQRYIVCFQEFAPGKLIYGFESVEACQAYFRHDSCARLRELGALIVLDILLNNMDRLPIALWNNDGNPGNVLFSTTIIGIDNEAKTLKLEYSGKYFEKIEKWARQVAKQQHDAPCFHSISKFFMENANWPLAASDRRALYQGCISAIRRMYQSPSSPAHHPHHE
jgi:hypothetical protein